MSPAAITLPVFGSASNNNQQAAAAGGQQSSGNNSNNSNNNNNNGEWDSGNADPMDFDLLAEYLLDDAGGNPVSFDFK
jgi:hypothetical protein